MANVQVENILQQIKGISVIIYSYGIIFEGTLFINLSGVIPIFSALTGTITQRSPTDDRNTTRSSHVTTARSKFHHGHEYVEWIKLLRHQIIPHVDSSRGYRGIGTNNSVQGDERRRQKRQKDDGKRTIRQYQRKTPCSFGRMEDEHNMSTSTTCALSCCRNNQPKAHTVYAKCDKLQPTSGCVETMNSTYVLQIHGTCLLYQHPVSLQESVVVGGSKAQGTSCTYSNMTVVKVTITAVVVVSFWSCLLCLVVIELRGHTRIAITSSLRVCSPSAPYMLSITINQYGPGLTNTVLSSIEDLIRFDLTLTQVLTSRQYTEVRVLVDRVLIGDRQASLSVHSFELMHTPHTTSLKHF